ncbi:hypothetical protein J4E91_006553 [Alternaria rosae]|nr:hypothetical protein J4E91_006553 [Alternaria rosae]
MSLLVRSALGKFTSSLNDSDIKEARSSLIAWSKSIQEEITTLIAQKVEKEAESNSRFRALMSLSSKSASEQQRQIALQNILNRCSTNDYETIRKQIRKAGNTCLYKRLPEYNQWVVAPASATLILVGKLGYGKSVTLANIVDDLILRIDPEAFGLAYFFCRHDLPESKHAKTVMGALIRQIISPLRDLLDESKVSETICLSQLLGLMRHVVPSKYVIYIVLDGLDICPPSEQKTITEHLELMTMQLNVHICISRRLEPGIELQAIAKDFPKATIARLPDNSSDIETYVVAHLEAALLDGSLVLGESSIILEIKKALLQGSQQMFLWVALQIQSLCMMQTDHDIRNALTNLPQDLSQIYSQILQQTKSPDQALRSNIFKLILAARRPLTLPDMREALSVTPGNTTWDPSKLLNSIYPALATCGCLINVDEEEHTIRTIHPSVNQYLLQTSLSSPDMVGENQLTMEDAQSLMSSIIITYLGYSVFGTELAVRLPVLNVGSAPANIINSTTGTSKGVLNLALKLLRSRKPANFDASNAFAQNFHLPRPPNMDDFVFQHYAKLYALQHLSTLPAVSCAAAENLLRMLKSDAIKIEADEEAIGLLWLMLQPPGRSDVLDLLEQIDLDTVTDLRSLSGDTPATLCPQLFKSAIANGRTQAIKYLLDLYHPLISTSPDTMHPNTNAAFTALRDYYAVLASGLSTMGLDGSKILSVATMIFFGRKPLCYAIKCYQDRALEVLMGYDVFDVNEGDTLRERPIGLAAMQQNIGALRILLSAGHRVKLQLTIQEANELMTLIEPIEDDSIPSLLSCIRAMHPYASVDKWSWGSDSIP